MAASAPPATLLISPCEDEAPCQLPAWCSAPDTRLGDACTQILRQPVGAPPELILLGQRAWFHFGRRHFAKGGRQPDVELRTRTASRKQALLLRNWHGQVFIMDIGSSHGTFLGQRRLDAHAAKEWKPGITLFFADRNTETFQLVPGRLPIPANLPRAREKDLPNKHESSSASATKFIGARRMMAAQLGGVAVPRPHVEAAHESVDVCDISASKKSQMTAPEEPPLYPGDWKVPADGLSAIGWKPESSVQPTPSKSSVPQALTTSVHKADQEASLRRPALAVRMERKLNSEFGPDVVRNLHAWGPHYPCPDHGPGWQLSLYTRTSARFDPARPAIVLTAASMKSPSAIYLEWLSNIPARRLHLRLTAAPPEVAEPAASNLWQVDLALPAGSDLKVCMSLPEASTTSLPAQFFVRICSADPLSHHGIPLGFEFGSSLRPLSCQDAVWGLDESVIERAKEKAVQSETAESHRASPAATSPLSPETEGILSSTSCASHASTCIASSEDAEPKQHPATESQSKTCIKEQSKSCQRMGPDVVHAANSSKASVSNRDFISNYCKQLFSRSTHKVSRAREHSSPSSSESGRLSGRSSEEALMRLSAKDLLRHMKKGIQSRQLTSPDFRCGRLRAAYSEALEQLCEDPRHPKRRRRIHD